MNLDCCHHLLNLKSGGGVERYVKNIKFCFEKKLLTNKLPIVTIAVQLKANNLLTCCVHNPSNATSSETFDLNEQYLYEILVPTETFEIVCGDLIVNLLQKN